MVTQWGPSAPTAAPPHFQPMSIVAKWSPISSTAELLLAKSESEIGKTRYVKIIKSIKIFKSSAVAEMGDRLATTDMGRKWRGAAVGALGPHWVTI